MCAASSNDGTGRFTDGSLGRSRSAARRLRHGAGRRRLRQRRLGRPLRHRRRATTRCCATSADGSTTSPATAGVGGAPNQWSTCATWFDADNDGDLDLFVCRYVQWSRDIDLKQDFSLAGIGRAYGPPRNFAGAAPSFYVNDGAGRFAERAVAAGLVVTDPVTRQPAAKSLGVALVHLDEDRLPRPGRRQRHGAQLRVPQPLRRHASRKWARRIGLAYDSYGNARSGHGHRHRRGPRRRRAGGGHRQLRQRDDRVLRQAAGARGSSSTRRFPAGIGAPSRAALTFGAVLLRLRPRRPARPADHQRPRRGPDQPWCRRASSTPRRRSCSGTPGRTAAATFALVGDAGGLAPPMVGRGGAYGDIDGDGDLDVLLVPSAGGVTAAAQRHTGGALAALRAGRRRPATATRSGAQVELTTSAGRRRRLVSPTHGYLSQSEPMRDLRPGARRDADVAAGAVADGFGADVDGAGDQSADDDHGSALERGRGPGTGD